MCRRFCFNFPKNILNFVNVLLKTTEIEHLERRQSERSLGDGRESTPSIQDSKISRKRKRKKVPTEKRVRF